MLTKYFKRVGYLVAAAWICSAAAGAYEDFFRAVNRDDADTVQALFKRGFDPNSRNPEGQTALHLALRDQSPRVALALWEHPELDVNAMNASGESPLMMAALRGDIAWSRRLIDRRAKVHLEGWSPLHYAATGSEPKVVAMLLDLGAPVDAASQNRTTPLMMAAGYGAEANVALLLARAADRRLRNDQDIDAAGFAARAGREHLAARLATQFR